MGIWLPTEFAEAFHFWKTRHNPPSGCGFPKGAQGAILTPTLDTPTRQPCGLSIPLPITTNWSRYWVWVLKNSSQQGVFDRCYWSSLAIWYQGRRWMSGKAAYWLASFSSWHSFLYCFAGSCHACLCSTGEWHHSFSLSHNFILFTIVIVRLPDDFLYSSYCAWDFLGVFPWVVDNSDDV